MNKKEFMFDISPLSSADVLEVKNLEQECKLSPWSVNDYYAEADRKDSLALVAKNKGKVVGFIIARLITKDKLKEYEIEVFNICVAENFRGNGIGQALFSKLNVVTENIVTTVWLEVRESNQRAISFYKALGFGIAGKRNNFYHDPRENGLIMRKVI
jgi:[ribosomal protein S18]-alanine N-acetyltransferase